jgi:hypothetical protein
MEITNMVLFYVAGLTFDSPQFFAIISRTAARIGLKAAFLASPREGGPAESINGLCWIRWNWARRSFPS